MSTVYLDTSVLGRVLFDEPDTPAIERELGRFDRRVSSHLLRVELRRAGLREDMLGDTERLLTGVVLMPIDEQILLVAETMQPPSVATLDAIHLTTAVRLADARKLDALMTYDERLADGARAHGLTVLSPS